MLRVSCFAFLFWFVPMQKCASRVDHKDLLRYIRERTLENAIFLNLTSPNFPQMSKLQHSMLGSLFNGLSLLEGREEVHGEFAAEAAQVHPVLVELVEGVAGLLKPREIRGVHLRKNLKNNSIEK